MAAATDFIALEGSQQMAAALWKTVGMICTELEKSLL